ncbi:MAG: hypothetical protein ACFFCQ_12770 [Promethearchaeota archaeon]
MRELDEKWKQSAPDFGEIVNLVAVKRYLQALYAQVRPFAPEEIVSFYGNTLLIIQRQNELRMEDKLNATAMWIEELDPSIFYRAVKLIKNQFISKVKDPQTVKKSLSLQIILDLAETSSSVQIATYFNNLKTKKSDDVIRTAELKLFKYFLSKSILPQQVAERALRRILSEILEFENLISD